MKHCPINMIRPFISVHWKVKNKKKVFPYVIHSKIKVSSPALLIIRLPKLANSIQSLHKPFQVRK